MKSGEGALTRSRAQRSSRQPRPPAAIACVHVDLARAAASGCAAALPERCYQLGIIASIPDRRASASASRMRRAGRCVSRLRSAIRAVTAANRDSNDGGGGAGTGGAGTSA